MIYQAFLVQSAPYGEKIYFPISQSNLWRRQSGQAPLWKKEYGGLRLDQAKRLKQLEKENSKLKKLLAEAELDKAILKEAASGNF